MAACKLWVMLLGSVYLGRAALGAVHTYNKEYFYSVGDAYMLQGGREATYASRKEAMKEWGHWGKLAPGVSNGQSQIKFTKLEFARPASIAAQFGPSEGFTGLIQAILFESNDSNLIGYPTAAGSRYCCSKELVPKTKCYQDRLIYQEKENGWPKVLDIYFENNNTLAHPWEEAITIEETGMYYLWFVICDESLASASVRGQTTWKNPTGYLPGTMQPHVKFFGIMSLAYITLGIMWAILYAKHWTEVFTLQHCITAIVALCMMEMSTWYFMYVHFNAWGIQSVTTTLCAVVLGCMRKTFSRILVLIVSMGFGVVLPYKGAVQRKIIALGAAYFVTISALDIGLNAGTIDKDLTSKTRITLMLPVAALDAILIVWVFTSLSRTLNELQACGATAKLDLYRTFRYTVAGMISITVAWTACIMYFTVTDQYKERWRDDWIITDFEHVLSLVFLSALCLLFLPSATSKRFSYIDSEGDGDYEQIEKGPVPPAPLGKQEDLATGGDLTPYAARPAVASSIG